MEEKRIKEIERWLDRYVNRECSKMEAVEGIDALYAAPDINNDAVRDQMKRFIDSYHFEPLNGHSHEFVQSIKRLCLGMTVIGAQWMRKKLTGK